jgi:hypothetical protein
MIMKLSLTATSSETGWYQHLSDTGYNVTAEDKKVDRFDRMSTDQPFFSPTP